MSEYMKCKHGNTNYCGLCVAEAAPKCKHGNPFFCGLCVAEAAQVKKTWVIEFRSGSFFQNLDADNGGPMKTARQFASKKEAEEFMDKHNWIYVNGGMAIPFKNG